MNKKLIICFDGMPYDLFSRENAPNLFEYAKTNKIIKLKTLFAFPGIEYTFFSGKNPDEHNIWLEHKYSPKTSPFKWQKYFSFLGRDILSYLTCLIQLIKGNHFFTTLYNIPYKIIKNFDFSTHQGIWELELFKDKNYLCYKWPFLVKNNKPKLKFRYASDKERCETLINNISPEIEIYAVQLVGLDKIIHRFGKYSSQAKEKIQELDSLISKTIQYFTKFIPNLEIFVWSDHGFVDVKNYVNLQRMLPKSSGCKAFYGGTTASFWFSNKYVKEQITQLLAKQTFGFILNETQRNKYKIPLSDEYGELIFAMNPGYYIFPNYYQLDKPFKSMHSYPTDKADFNGIFITNKKLSSSSLNMHEAMGAILE